jgi:hypothetical protein
MFIASDERQMSLALIGIDRASGRWWQAPMKLDSWPIHSGSKTNLVKKLGSNGGITSRFLISLLSSAEAQGSSCYNKQRIFPFVENRRDLVECP